MTRPAEPVPQELIAGIGGAAVLAVVLLATKSGVAGGVVGGLAAFGLLARWPPAAPLVLLLTAYFSVFPQGVPADPQGRGVTAGPQLLDLLAAGAAVVYLAGNYRHLARARDDAGEPPADDLAGLLGGTAAAALFGQAALSLVGRFRPDYARGPLRFVRVAESDPPDEAAFARFVVLAGLLGGGGLLAGLGFWLARLNRLSAAEARQLLLDVRWREGRRELARLETWRARAVGRRLPRPWRTVPLRRLLRVSVLTLLVGAPLVACGSLAALAWLPVRWRVF